MFKIKNKNLIFFGMLFSLSGLKSDISISSALSSTVQIALASGLIKTNEILNKFSFESEVKSDLNWNSIEKVNGILNFSKYSLTSSLREVILKNIILEGCMEKIFSVAKELNLVKNETKKSFGTAGRLFGLVGSIKSLKNSDFKDLKNKKRFFAIIIALGLSKFGANVLLDNNIKEFNYFLDNNFPERKNLNVIAAQTIKVILKNHFLRTIFAYFIALESMKTSKEELVNKIEDLKLEERDLEAYEKAIEEYEENLNEIYKKNNRFVDFINNTGMFIKAII